MTKYVKFEDFLERQLRDPEFRKEYERLQPEFEIISAIIRHRIDTGMTQKELAKKVGTKQSAISRLESGNANPSIGFLSKIAEALGTRLQLSFK